MQTLILGQIQIQAENQGLERERETKGRERNEEGERDRGRGTVNGGDAGFRRWRANSWRDPTSSRRSENQGLQRERAEVERENRGRERERYRRRSAMPPPSGDSSSGASKILLGRYEVGRLLGCGAFAKVYHARHALSGQSVAIKCISKMAALRGGLGPNVRREIAALRRLRHPHVLRLLEVLASRSKIYLVLELAKGGELFARISSRGRLSEDLARRLFHQLVSAVGFCHARGVFHRDLKPENLLLDEYGDLKISDFGLAALSEQQIRSDGLLHTLCGTPAYVAPEILSKKGYNGAKTDIWSCGVILFVLNAGYLPFNDPNLMALYRKIYRGEYRFPRWTSPELRRLISRLLDVNPDTRITVDGIIRDPWFRKGLNENRLLVLLRFHSEVEDRIANLEAAAAEEEDDEGEPDRDVNAFDIISLSTGFDLSGLFRTGSDRERFLVGEAAEGVMARVEAAAAAEGAAVRMRWTRRRGGAAVERMGGDLLAWVEVYRMTSQLAVVEVERGGGEEAERFWRERLEPSLWGRVAGGEPVELVVEPVGE